MLLMIGKMYIIISIHYSYITLSKKQLTMWSIYILPIPCNQTDSKKILIGNLFCIGV